MCGIAGFSGNNPVNIDKFTTLLIMNQDRGKETLGIFTPEGGVKKECGTAISNLSKEEIEWIPSISKMVLGHVRQSTVGMNIVSNAHPFQRGNVVLIMNGTLSNHWDLLREHKLSYADYTVDSDILCGVLASTQKTDVLKHINGGCAILFYDTKTELMYAFRNKERPLFYGMIDGDMYMSSIKESLEVIKCKDVESFDENWLYEIKNGIIAQKWEMKKQIPIKMLPDPDSNNPNSHSSLMLANKNDEKIFVDLKLSSRSNKELVGTWVELLNDTYCTSTCSMMTKSLSNDNKWLVVHPHINTPSDSVCIKESKESHYSYVISKDKLSNFTEQVGKGTYLKCTNDVLYTKGGTFTFEGELCIVVYCNKKAGQIKVKSLISNEEALYTWKNNDYRSLTYKEQTKMIAELNMFRTDYSGIGAMNNTQTTPPRKVSLSEQEVFELYLKEKKFEYYESFCEFILKNLGEELEIFEKISRLNAIEKASLDKMKAIMKHYKEEEVKFEHTDIEEEEVVEHG